MGPEQPGGFGRLLKQLRGRAGLTQEELAEQAGLSARALSDLERGVNSRPRAATLHLLAEALQLDATERAQLEASARRRGAGISMDSARGASAPEAVPWGAVRLPLVGRAAELATLQ